MKNTKRAIILIIISSLCAGIGQLMWKKVSLSLNLQSLAIPYAPLAIGISLYILATVFMVLAFKDGELSLLHPFLATSFIWVTLVSPVFFSSESITPFKLLGSFLIFSGVSLIGLGGKNAR